MNASEFWGAGAGSFRRCRKRINQAGAFLALFLFVSSSVSGWIFRGLHDNDWRIAPPPNRWHPATLVDVIDGDTIKVKWEGTVTSVRLLNIDTPERGRPGFTEATNHLRSLLNDATAVMLEFEKDGVHARDRYDRLLCYVWLNGKCLNVEMVRARHSLFYTKYGTGKYPENFQAAEATRNEPVPTEP